MRVLTVDACRRLLSPDVNRCDHEIEKIRGQLTTLAMVGLDIFSEWSRSRRPSTRDRAQDPVGAPAKLGARSPAESAHAAASSTPPKHLRQLRNLSAAELEGLEERVAIRQFESGMDRTSAEILTIKEFLERRGTP